MSSAAGIFVYAVRPLRRKRVAELFVAACLGLLALIWPAQLAHAAPQVPITVDHPAADGVTSFDSGQRSGRLVALTFDADMTPGMLALLRRGSVQSWYNREVIELLRSQRVPATLFLTGLWASTYQEDARALAADPLFEIGSHTVDHLTFRVPCYGLAAATNRRWEITESQHMIQAATGTAPTLLRFPGDCYAREDVSLAHELGLTVISGDVRAGDGFNPSAAAIASRVESQTRPGSIVVMHLHGGPYAPMTAPALRRIIPALRQRRLEFGTVSQLLGLAKQQADRPDQSSSDREQRLLVTPGTDILGQRRHHFLQPPRAMMRPHMDFWPRLLLPL